MGWPRSSCSTGTISTARATMMGLSSSIFGQSGGTVRCSSECRDRQPNSLKSVLEGQGGLHQEPSFISVETVMPY